MSWYSLYLTTMLSDLLKSQWDIGVDEENILLLSQYSTLVFLQTLGTVPTPRVFGACFDGNNPAKTSYYIMEKLPGVPLSRAFNENKIERELVFEMLKQLADFQRALAGRPFRQVGSLVMSDKYVLVDAQLTARQFYSDGWAAIQTRPCPFSSGTSYYVNLLQERWSALQKTYPNTEEAWLHWKVHNYLSSILISYVKSEVDKFYLAHTDLNLCNILIDPKTGSITGIIDWEFACTVPAQATDHFPLLLRKDRFIEEFQDTYDDPETELEVWRTFYAKQFDGDDAMQEYLENIDAAIAFEDILKDNRLATVENLVENCKFLESAETLDKMKVPFPWKSPTKERSPPLSTETDSSNTSVNGKLEGVVKMELISEDDDDNNNKVMANGGDHETIISSSQSAPTEYKRRPAGTAIPEMSKGEVQTDNSSYNDSPTTMTNGGDDGTNISPSQSIHANHDERPPTTSTPEMVEMETHTEIFSHDDYPTTNGGDDMRTISPSQSVHSQHDESPTTISTPNNGTNGGNGGTHGTFSHNDPPLQTADTAKPPSLNLKLRTRNTTRNLHHRHSPRKKSNQPH